MTNAGWLVSLTQEKCSVCEVCARICPTGALHIDKGGETLELSFDGSLCNGCPEGNSCQSICPEEAITLSEGASPEGAVVLLQSPLLKCSYCGDHYAPSQKLDAIAGKLADKHEAVRDYCPLCRRTQLVVKYIQDNRAPPGQEAKYRSATAIIRGAGYGPEEGQPLTGREHHKFVNSRKPMVDDYPKD